MRVWRIVSPLSVLDCVNVLMCGVLTIFTFFSFRVLQYFSLTGIDQTFHSFRRGSSSDFTLFILVYLCYSRPLRSLSLIVHVSGTLPLLLFYRILTVLRLHRPIVLRSPSFHIYTSPSTLNLVHLGISVSIPKTRDRFLVTLR